MRSPRKLWKQYAPRMWWGDPLDVRFELARIMSKLEEKRILDVGSSAGILLSFASNSNTKMGVEIDSNAIKIAKKVHRDLLSSATFLCEDAFKIKFPEDSFDVIILAHVLPGHDYVSKKSPATLIKRAATWLTEDGIMYLTTPNKGSPYNKDSNKMTREQLEFALRKAQVSYEIHCYNPLPIQAGHLLRFVPGIRLFLCWLMKQNVGSSRANAFFVRIWKPS